MTADPAQTDPHADRALERIKGWWMAARERWARLAELETVAPADLDRIAADLGVPSAELREVVARPMSASALLVRRLRALGLDEADAAALSRKLLADLHRTCAACTATATCRRDLDHAPAADGWAAYCPNAVELADMFSHAAVTRLSNPQTKHR
jgi:hypothetical protein